MLIFDLLHGIKIILALVGLFYFASLNAVENLGKDDYEGIWKDYEAVVMNTKQQLTINSDHSSAFERNFKDGKTQYFKATPKDFFQLDDVIIIEFGEKCDQLAYKLVLSGWKMFENKALYGMMYMYSDCKQFNGVGISLRNDLLDPPQQN